MSMSVTLYQGAKVNGTSRMGLWASLTEQKDYFDSLSRITYSTGTVKLGEPLRLNATVSTIMSYDYGAIDYGDGFRYYFTINDLQMVTETLTDVYYSIDCYETLVCQKPFNYGRAHIIRYPDQIGKPMLSYEPNIITKVKSHTLVLTYNLIAVAWGSADNHYYTILIPSTNTHHITTDDWFNGSWFSKIKAIYSLQLSDVTESDIIITGIVPGVIDGVTDTQVYNDLVEEMGITANSVLDANTVSSDHTKISVIKDCRGNIVYTCPIGHSYDISSPISTLISITNISLMITLTKTGTSGNTTKEYVRIPCENVSWVIDSWQEYAVRQRQVDIETRNNQNTKSLVSGLIQASESAVMGSLFGGGGKGGLTSAQGAIAGAGGGLVSALGNYAVNMLYAGKEQGLIDKSYQYANDMLINMGDFSYSELHEYKVGLYNLEYDSVEQNTNDIEVNGYPVSVSVDSFNNYIKKGKIQAEIEILDISSKSWKDEIQTRFSQGVYLV